MKKDPKDRVSDDTRAEYDFSGAKRGKYPARYAAGSNVVVLEPDVAQLFPSTKTVNDALRRVAGLDWHTCDSASHTAPDRRMNMSGGMAPCLRVQQRNFGGSLSVPEFSASQQGWSASSHWKPAFVPDPARRNGQTAALPGRFLVGCLGGLRR